MQTRRTVPLVSLWLVLSLSFSLLLFLAGRSALQQDLRHHVGKLLQSALDESLFSSTGSRLTDREGLGRIGDEINADMEGLVTSRWYAPWRDCAVRILRVEDVTIQSGPMPNTFALSLQRNRVPREVVLGMSCSPNIVPSVVVTALLGLLFAAVAHFLPPPHSAAQRRWFNYLREAGYDADRALQVVAPYGGSTLELNDVQRDCVEHLHDHETQNFADALAVATDARVARLEHRLLDWFLLGLEKYRGNVGQALALAWAEDAVVIDLPGRRLSIRGLDVPMSATPLFYYAWYARHRKAGEGWVTNPASNRPDMEVGRELARLMSAYEGHARAINDLEHSGLKARTLDQNRSKIKDELVAVLGEQLAGAYLFESGKHLDGLHMMYRLCPQAQQIQILT